ncbi:hypothetical protein BX666DRAFT_1865287 [Dichotomocladium elegans]|nr:hypothetical protein BX666DRAFT_1865287 [Dichotomocladium elegans]
MVVLGFVSWLFLANFEPRSTYGTNSQTIYLLVPIACGLVGSCLMVCIVTPVTLMALGGLGGVAAGLWVLGWRDELTLHSDWARAVLLVILAVLGCTFSAIDYFFHMIGASFTGAYILMLALDIYFHTGFSYCFLATFDRNPAHGMSTG